MVAYVQLALMGALVTAAAWLLAARAYLKHPAEAFVACGVYVVGLICAPILGLGWLGRLTAPDLSFVTLLLAGGVAAAALGRTPRRRLREALRRLGNVLRLPLMALAEGWNERSVAGLSLLPAAAIFLWTLALSYLAPASGWDGLWYHDPIVGFAIQNHGFAWVDVPPRLGMVNGYPKTAELLHLWMAIFAGRTLLEAPNSLLAPLLVASVYVLLRRLSIRRTVALTVALVFFFTPGVALQLRSTYVDMAFVTIVAATLCFVMRSPLRPADALTAALGLGLLTGMKTTGLVVGAIAFALLAARLVRGRVRFAGTLTATACASMLLLAGPYYARTWIKKGNPVWPAELHVPALGIAWNGPIRFARRPLTLRNARALAAWPKAGVQFHDSRDNGYGNVFPFWLLLAFAGLCLASAGAFFSRAGWRLRAYRRALALTVPLLLTFAVSPAWWWARLNLHVVLACFTLAALFVDRWPRWLRELAGLASVSVSLLVLYVSEPGWGVSPKLAKAMLSMTAQERAAQQLLRRMPTPEVALSREKELKKNAIVAIVDDFTLPGPLWNEAYSNRVQYVPWRGRRNFLHRLEELEVAWVTVHKDSRQHKALRRRPEDWELVGVINPGHLAYRHLAQSLQTRSSR